MNTSPKNDAAISDTQEQIRELRAQLDSLIAGKIDPALHAAVDKAGSVAENASKLIETDLAMVTDAIRKRPITAVAVALAAGFLFARLTR